MTKLLRKLTHDVPVLNENTVIPLRVLTSYYERCGRYYSVGGWGSYGSATEEEKRLTMMLFTGIFDALAQRSYDPELFSKALPCLSAIGCALSPDYSLSNHDDHWLQDSSEDFNGSYNPQPVDTGRIKLNQNYDVTINRFAEHFHDCWAIKKIDQGWVFGTNYDDERKTHPKLKPYHLLDEESKSKYMSPIKENLKVMLYWGWSLEQDQARLQANRESMRRRMSKDGGSSWIQS